MTEFLVLVVVLLVAIGIARLRARDEGRKATSDDFGEQGAARSKARVAQVLDGDTVIVVRKRHRVRVRLDSIDCPEDGQPWGDTAKYGLIKLIGGREVLLEVHGTDIHGRTLATIYVEDRETRRVLNVNERMITLGHAWVMRKYYQHLPAGRRKQLDRLERWAKSKRVGLWRTPNPVPPWQWRHRGPERAAEASAD